MFVIDTMVISEPGKRAPHVATMAWLSRQSLASLFITAVSIMEIERGIALAEQRDGRYASRLRGWLDDTINRFGSRILSIDVEVARLAGRVQAKAGHRGNDTLIAATALANGLTVATRNVSDFEPLGVETFNPYDAT